MDPWATEPAPLRDTRAAHLVRAGIVGSLAGLLAVAFRKALTEAELLRAFLLDHLHALPHANAWAWCILPLGGLIIGSLVGLMVLRLSPEASGSGIPHIKGVLVHLRALRWRSLLPVKFFGGVLGIGAGLSMGREGPTVQMGAAVGQAVANLMRVPSRSVPQLLSCGAGAGLAAAFNAPLAGFVFVIEELHREMSARTFAGALIAALSADVVTRALSGDLPSFAVSGYPAIPLSALPLAAGIGALGGLLGVLFNRGLLQGPRLWAWFRRLPVWVRPGVAAALCGLAAWWIPEAVGGGHRTADHLLRGEMTATAQWLVVLLAVKFVLTIVSYASGAPGGIFAPMLMMGAVMGMLVGKGVMTASPELGAYATAYGILGMAAFFTGSVRAPLTAIVLIIDLTGNYQQLLAVGVACLTADLIAGALRDRPIYEALLEADLQRLPKTQTGVQAVTEPRSVYIGIQRGSQLQGKAIRDAKLPPGCLIVSIERSGREVLPEADLVLLPGDHVSVLVPADEPEKSLVIVRLATGL